MCEVLSSRVGRTVEAGDVCRSLVQILLPLSATLLVEGKDAGVLIRIDDGVTGDGLIDDDGNSPQDASQTYAQATLPVAAEAVSLFRYLLGSEQWGRLIEEELSRPLRLLADTTSATTILCTQQPSHADSLAVASMPVASVVDSASSDGQEAHTNTSINGAIEPSTTVISPTTDNTTVSLTTIRAAVAALSILGGHIDAPYPQCPAIIDSGSGTESGGAVESLFGANFAVVTEVFHGSDAVEVATSTSAISLTASQSSSSGASLTHPSGRRDDEGRGGRFSDSPPSSTSHSNQQSLSQEGVRSVSIVTWDRIRAMNRCPFEGVHVSESLVLDVLRVAYNVVLHPVTINHPKKSTENAVNTSSSSSSGITSAIHTTPGIAPEKRSSALVWAEEEDKLERFQREDKDISEGPPATSTNSTPMTTMPTAADKTKDSESTAMSKDYTTPPSMVSTKSTGGGYAPRNNVPPDSDPPHNGMSGNQDRKKLTSMYGRIPTPSTPSAPGGVSGKTTPNPAAVIASITATEADTAFARATRSLAHVSCRALSALSCHPITSTTVLRLVCNDTMKSVSTTAKVSTSTAAINSTKDNVLLSSPTLPHDFSLRLLERATEATKSAGLADLGIVEESLLMKLQERRKLIYTSLQKAVLAMNTPAVKGPSGSAVSTGAAKAPKRVAGGGGGDGGGGGPGPSDAPDSAPSLSMRGDASMLRALVALASSDHTTPIIASIRRSNNIDPAGSSMLAEDEDEHDAQLQLDMLTMSASMDPYLPMDMQSPHGADGTMADGNANQRTSSNSDRRRAFTGGRGASSAGTRVGTRESPRSGAGGRGASHSTPPSASSPAHAAAPTSTGVPSPQRAGGQTSHAPAPASFGQYDMVDPMMMETLIGMGFPERWCELALDLCGGDLDEALNYILSNSDSLEQMVFASDVASTVTSTEETTTAPADTTAPALTESTPDTSATTDATGISAPVSDLPLLPVATPSSNTDAPTATEGTTATDLAVVSDGAAVIPVTSSGSSSSGDSSSGSSADSSGDDDDDDGEVEAMSVDDEIEEDEGDTEEEDLAVLWNSLSAPSNANGTSSTSDGDNHGHNTDAMRVHEDAAMKANAMIIADGDDEGEGTEEGEHVDDGHGRFSHHSNTGHDAGAAADEDHSLEELDEHDEEEDEEDDEGDEEPDGDDDYHDAADERDPVLPSMDNQKEYHYRGIGGKLLALYSEPSLTSERLCSLFPGDDILAYGALALDASQSSELGGLGGGLPGVPDFWLKLRLSDYEDDAEYTSEVEADFFHELFVWAPRFVAADAGSHSSRHGWEEVIFKGTGDGEHRPLADPPSEIFPIHAIYAVTGSGGALVRDGPEVRDLIIALGIPTEPEPNIVVSPKCLSLYYLISYFFIIISFYGVLTDHEP